jgi:hypothetical protein
MISFDFIKGCLQNIILEVLSEDYLKKLKSIINQVYNNNEDKRQLYLLLFNKLKNLKGLFNLWEIFDYSKFNKDEEKFINIHIKKFWDLFNFDKNNRDNYTYFGKMFLFLKNSKNNQNKFLLKITKIENLQLVIEIINEIIINENKDFDENSDFNVSSDFDENKIILNYFMNLSNKQIKSIKFTDSIFNFLLNNINDKNIEIDDFYENNKITIFRISKILIELNNDFKNSNIYKKSSNISNIFSNLVKENKINFSQLKRLNSLIEDHLFNEKLIFLDNEKRNSLEQNIQNKYKDVKQKKQNLEESLEYLKVISSNGDIKKINMVNSAIGYLDKSIKKFEQNFEEKKDSFNELFKRVEKFSKMKSLKGHLLFIDELEIRIDEEDGKLKFLETKLKE